MSRLQSRNAKDDKDKMKQPIMLEQVQVQQEQNRQQIKREQELYDR